MLMTEDGFIPMKIPNDNAPTVLSAVTGGLGSSDREQGFISGKLPCVKIHAAACFCDSVLK
jgi:hypothetical protein